ncbi:MAG: hypothetical protein UU34_C0001G0142 [Candidatus Curtissbacteria bacterium GW2011_GWA1_41_11]|uniref:Glycosyltransferase RgtA/B/C/D-like domain-containing protein n=1 Tax=Candidatus Curtissbacteria bacterium GW2011_GWA1_41_11 TaxID=1618409 RepID=A0A0G0WUP4_9BACT|nr:MAG: hypothetical protein UU34_C0001G0142 [Candidatus Curtissbacteria bacterium GW2011_GWA1_41_11]
MLLKNHKNFVVNKPQLLIWLILSFIFLFSRLINLSTLPLFSDEAYVIARAQELWQTGDLLGMIKFTTQPILIWLVALFIKLPLGTVFAARLVSTLMGLITALLLAFTAGKFIHSNAKWLAFLIMMILPFPFFYDRTLLFESSLLTWMTLAIFVPVVGLPLAILTKQIGWLSVPVIVMLHVKKIKILSISLITTFLVIFAIWLLALGSWEQIFKIIISQTAAPIGVNANFKANLLLSKLWLTTYITWPFLLLMLLGLIREGVLTIKKRGLRPILLIGLWSLLILFVETKIAVIFYPRYLYPILIGVVLLATSALWMLFTLIRNYKNPLRLVTVLIGLIVIFYPSIKFGYTFMNSPKQSAIAHEDKLQFFDDWTSGVGSNEINIEIEKYLRSNNNLTVYVESENSYFITLQRRNNPNFEIEIAHWLNEPLNEIPTNILEQENETWFVRNRHPDIPEDWPVTLITKVQKSPSRYVYLYRIIKQ